MNTSAAQGTRKTNWPLVLCLLLAFGVRLPMLGAPLADHHSWNQCSAAMVIRHFHEDGIDLLHPEWDHLAKNSAARRIGAEELPLYHAIVASLYGLAGGERIALARLVSIAFSLAAALYLYLLVRRKSGESAGLLAAFFFSLAPLTWFFGRAVMSDSAMLCATVAALFHFVRWTDAEGERDFVLAIVWTAFAGLLKPFALLVGVPILGLWLRKNGLRMLASPRPYLFAVLTLAPTAAWLAHALTVGDLGGVTDKADIAKTDKIWGPVALLWDPAFYYKLQWRLLDRAITPVASVLAGIGLVATWRRPEVRFARYWLLGVLAYLLIVRNGNFVHDYYQLPFVPVASALAALGVVWIVRRAGSARWAVVAAVVVCTGFAVVSFLYVRGFYRPDRSGVVAGNLVRSHSEPGDLLYVLDRGATRMNQVIFYAHRRGWHTSRCDPQRIAEYRLLGAARFVAVLEPGQPEAWASCFEELDRTYPLLVESSDPPGTLPKPHIYKIYGLKEES